MTWKIERWLEDVFPGESEIYAAYRNLPARELAIVSAAVLDSALATLLERRLRNLPGEVESFLGANGDGRAPAASFGARIQLALLLGILTEDEAAILRQIKNLRNVFAHTVKVDFCSEAARKPLRSLYDAWFRNCESLTTKGLMRLDLSELRKIETHLGDIPEAGEGLLLSTFTVLHALLHRLSDRIDRVELIR